MAKTTGIGLSELSTAFNFLEPDVVLVIGDRHEVMAAAIAATYMNIRVAHIMGGEVSGTIDESTRHAITKFAHIHFPASPLARDRIIKMGENPKFVFKVGCPRIDEVAKILKKINGKKERVVFEGVGDKINFDEPFLFVSQHPVTTEFGDCEKQINETLKAIVNVKMPTIMLWPNNDAGGEDIARGIRKFREKNKMLDFPIHFFKNLPMDKYFYLMNKTSCMIGNSSSLVREGSFIGTPAVLIGTRQQNRECADNLIKVGHSSEEIIRAVKKQISRGKAGSSKLYGDGKAGKRIADILAKTEAPIQKTFYM